MRLDLQSVLAALEAAAAPAEPGLPTAGAADGESVFVPLLAQLLGEGEELDGDAPAEEQALADAELAREFASADSEMAGSVPPAIAARAESGPVARFPAAGSEGPARALDVPSIPGATAARSGSSEATAEVPTDVASATARAPEPPVLAAPVAPAPVPGRPDARASQGRLPELPATPPVETVPTASAAPPPVASSGPDREPNPEPNRDPAREPDLARLARPADSAAGAGREELQSPEAAAGRNARLGPPQPAASQHRADPAAALQNAAPEPAAAPDASLVNAASTATAASARAGAEAIVPAHSVGSALPAHVDWLVSRGGGTAKLRLDPPQLGEVEISVRVRGREVEIVIQTEAPAAHQLVGDARERLVEGLAGRELRLESLDLRGPDTGSPGRDERGASFASGDGRGEDAQGRPGGGSAPSGAAGSVPQVAETISARPADSAGVDLLV